MSFAKRINGTIGQLMCEHCKGEQILYLAKADYRANMYLRT